MKFDNNTCSYNKKILSVLLTGFLYLIAYLFLNVVFEDGDDVGMQQIIQGAASGNPDVHLVFINIIIGYLLKPFYILNYQIYWYSLLMVFLQFISLSVVLFFLLKHNIRWYVVLSVMFFSLYFIVRLQFTSIAGLLTIAGFLLLHHSIITNEVRHYLISFLFLWFSLLLRLEMFLITGSICFLFVLSEKYPDYRMIIKKKLFLYFTSMLLFASIFSIWINYKSYHGDAEWTYYYQYNMERGKFNDNPNSSYFKKKLLDKKNGPEYLEYNLASKFIFPGSYDLEKISGLVKEMKPDWKQKIHNVYLGLHEKAVFFSMLLLLSLAFLFFRKKLYFKLLPIALFFLSFVYICLEHFYKERVLFPIVLACIIFAILSRDKVSLKMVAFGVVLLGVFNFLNYPKPIESGQLPQIPEDKFVVLLAPYKFSQHPFQLNDQNKYTNLVRKGWLINSPIYLNKFRKKGLKVNQHLSYIDDEVLSKKLLYHINETNPNFKLLNNYLSLNNKKLVPFESYPDLYCIR